MPLIDLSFPLEHGQLNFPADPKISVVVHNTVATIQYNMTQISMGTHQGTHLDAPFHFYADGKTIDQMRLDQFYGPCTLIDLAPGTHLPAKAPITVEMFERFASHFTPNAKLIYRTGWDRAFGRAEYFTDFPTLTLEAARWLASKKIGMIGMDTPTPSQQWLECHHILLAKDVEMVIVEGLRNLASLPEKFTFIGFPLNIKGRDGSPIRAVALTD